MELAVSVRCYAVDNCLRKMEIWRAELSVLLFMCEWTALLQAETIPKT